MRALVLVDIQNDFLGGGALAVKDADAIIPVVNALTDQFALVVATRDWHPENHGSFAATHGKAVGEVILLDGIDQILWPVHCIQGSRGARFPEALHTDKIDTIIDSGTDPMVDSYSGFFDNQRRHATALESYLRQHDVDHLFVVGLATDYCVKFTVLDALGLGFQVTVVADGMRPVNLQSGDGARALEEMQQAGAMLMQAREVLV